MPKKTSRKIIPSLSVGFVLMPSFTLLPFQRLSMPCAWPLMRVITVNKFNCRWTSMGPI